MTLQERRAAPVLDWVITITRTTTTADPFDTFGPGTTTTEDKNVWAARIERRISDQIEAGQGFLYTNVERSHVIRYDSTYAKLGTDDHLTDEDGEQRRIRGAVEWGGRRRYLELLTGNK